MPLQDLQYLNLAVNNITKVQNVQRCESLQKLDLTLNFVPKAGLLSIASLAGNHNLRELFLVGNPCTDWHGYRQYVIGTLPHLAKLVSSCTSGNSSNVRHRCSSSCRQKCSNKPSLSKQTLALNKSVNTIC